MDRRIARQRERNHPRDHAGRGEHDEQPLRVADLHRLPFGDLETAPDEPPHLQVRRGAADDGRDELGEAARLTRELGQDDDARRRLEDRQRGEAARPLREVTLGKLPLNVEKKESDRKRPDEMQRDAFERVRRHHRLRRISTDCSLPIRHTHPFELRESWPKDAGKEGRKQG